MDQDRDASTASQPPARLPDGAPARLLLVFAALVAAMGLRLALTPWLDDAMPVILGVPAVAAIAVRCGWRWGALLGALVLAWVSVPWLPPNWPVENWAYRGASALALAIAACVGLLARAPSVSAIPGAAPGEHPALDAAQRALKISMGIAVALPVALLGGLAWTSQNAALVRASHQAESAMQVAAEHVSRVVQANTIITRQVLTRLAAVAPERVAAEQPVLHRYLAELVQGLPQVNSIWVIGADGHPIASSLFAAVPRINYADREYFRFHAANRDQVYVSRLLRTRSTQELFFDVSARWEDAEGRFLGVINVTLQPGYFTDFYRQVAQSTPAISIALARDDGYFIARWPDPPNVGDRLPADHVLLRTAPRDGTPAWVRGVAARGLAGDTAVFRRLDPFPLHLVVALDRNAVRRAWARDVAALGAVTLAGSLLLIAVLAVALRRTRNELAALDRLATEQKHRRRAEEALRQSQKLEALGQLTGGVAHDFNNLLAVVQNNLHVVAHRFPDVAGTPAYAGMRRAVRSGEQLTRKLLAFSRRQALRPEVLDLAQVIPQIVDMMRLSLGSAIRVNVDVARGVPAVKIDRSELELALLNLATNARGAMRGSGRIDVVAREAYRADLPPEFVLDPRRDAGRFVLLSVTDDGEGMTPEVLERAFEPFFTTRPEGKGTGLGLSQVYGLCAQSGGTARIASTPGAGTTVSLILPASEERPIAAEPAGAGTVTEVNAHVLVVDDNADLAQATAAVLVAMGARVTVAADPAAAMRVLSAAGHGIDIVLSDVVMPGGMSGIDLARALEGSHPRLPVVLATGYTTELGSAVAAGFVVLQKPVAPATLATALDQALRRRASPAA